MNKFETKKAEKDGLDVWPDLLAYAANGTPIGEIPEADLSRMKWYGVSRCHLPRGSSCARYPARNFEGAEQARRN